ncbi:MAG: hypothetical protein AB1941_27500 [Gemmatimonadota bacterium]
MPPTIPIDIYVDGVHLERTEACGGAHVARLEEEWGQLGSVSIATVPRDFQRQSLPPRPFAEAKIVRGARPGTTA